MTTATIVSAIGKLQDLLEGMNDGATPTHTHTFAQVFIGEPDKIPLKAKRIAIINPVNDPNFYYTTCKTKLQWDTDVYVEIICKGRLEEAVLDNLQTTEDFKYALRNDPKLTNTVLDSTIEEVIYGDFGLEGKQLLAASRLTVRLHMGN